MVNLFKMDMYKFYKKKHLLLAVAIPVLAIFITVGTLVFKDMLKQTVDENSFEGSAVYAENDIYSGSVVSDYVKDMASEDSSEGIELEEILRRHFTENAGYVRVLTAVFVGLTAARDFTTKTVNN